MIASSVLLNIIALLFFASVPGSAPKNTGDATNNSDSQKSDVVALQEEKAESYYFKDNVLVTPEFRIEITQHEIVQYGGENNSRNANTNKKPIIAFWYKITNFSDKTIDAFNSWVLSFEAYQGSGQFEQKINLDQLHDERLKSTIAHSIAKDETIEYAVAYELGNDTLPITLKYKNEKYTGEKEYQVN
jgi:hypothetical protein